MSAPQQEASSTPDNSYSSSLPAHGAPPSGWVVGLSLFAGILMITAGVFNAVEGLVALFRNAREYIFAFDLTMWGWIHLILGLVVMATGFGVISGRLWGRIVGIAIAVLSTLANFLFVPYYPVWSLLIIALNVFVIWALCVFDRDAATG